MTETMGELIKRYLALRGWNATELAERIARSPGFVSRLVNDVPKEMPGPDVFAALESVLGVPQRQLLQSWGYLRDERSNEADPAFVLLMERLKPLTPEQWRAVEAYALVLTDPRMRDPEFIKGTQEAAEQKLRWFPQRDAEH